MLQASANCHAVCLCQLHHEHENASGDHAHLHSDSHHHEHSTPEIPRECCCESSPCNLLGAGTIEVVTRGEFIPVLLKEESTNLLSNHVFPHRNLSSDCNSYAATIRLRAEIWLI